MESQKKGADVTPIRVVQTTVEEIDPEHFEKARRASGLSRAELCRRAGVHEQYVSRLERGLVATIPTEIFDKLVEGMVGAGEFEELGKADVLAVMRGRASFHLRLVGDDQPATQPLDLRVKYNAA